MISKPQLAEQELSADSKFSRRSFLRKIWLGLGVLTAGEGILVALRYWGSRRADNPAGTTIAVGRPDDFSPGTLTLFPEARLALVRLDDGGFLALHLKCTHLACVVSWDDEEGSFVCPCHGSRFDRTGAVLNTPALRPLGRFHLNISATEIEVDTGHLVERIHVSPDDVTYWSGE